MSTPANVPFVRGLRFPGTFDATKLALEAFLDYAGQARHEEDRDELRTRFSTIPFEVKLDALDADAFFGWWDHQASLVPDGDDPLDPSPLSADFHPLLRLCLVEPAALDRHRSTWFTKEGGSRRRSLSIASGRGTASDYFSDVEQDEQEEGGDDGLVVVEGGEGGEGDDPVIVDKGKGRAYSPRLGDGAGSPSSHTVTGEDDADQPRREPTPSGSGLPRSSGAKHGARGIAGLLEHPLPPRPQQAQGARPYGASGTGGGSNPLPNRPSQGPPPPPVPPVRPPGGFPPRQPHVPLHYVVEPDPGSATSAYAAGIKARLAAKEPSVLVEPLPAWAEALRAAIAQRRIDFYDKTRKPGLIAGWHYLASALPVDLADIQKAALGEYVELTALRDYQPPASHDVDSTFLDILQLSHLKKRTRSEGSLDPFVWDRYFRLWAEVVEMVNHDVPYEQERKLDVERYRNFIINELNRASPEVRLRLLQYDEVVRKEIARPGPDSRIRFFGECKTNDTLFLSIVVNPSSSAYAGLANPRSKAKTGPSASFPSHPVYDAQSDICGRYNDRVPHEDGCGRRHVCRICEGAHVASECTSRGGGAAGGGGGGKKQGGAQPGGRAAHRG